MKNALGLLIVCLLLSAPALAEYTSLLLEQSFTMTTRSSFSMDKGANTAKLSGRGSAVLDGGAQAIYPGPGGLALEVTFGDLNDPVFQQCLPGLAAELPRRYAITVSGRGDFTRVMMNGVMSQVSIRMTGLTACTVAHM